jgi:hypothetical protein
MLFIAESPGAKSTPVIQAKEEGTEEVRERSLLAFGRAIGHSFSCFSETRMQSWSVSTKSRNDNRNTLTTGNISKSIF